MPVYVSLRYLFWRAAHGRRSASGRTLQRRAVL